METSFTCCNCSSFFAIFIMVGQLRHSANVFSIMSSMSGAFAYMANSTSCTDNVAYGGIAHFGVLPSLQICCGDVKLVMKLF